MYTLNEAQGLPEQLVGTETKRLGQHLELVPAAFVISPDVETGFYQQTNLPAQLSALFAPVRPGRIDEDALEPLCVQASRLILGSALLDDTVQQVYRALHNAGLNVGAVHLRRPGERRAQQAQARSPGVEVLHALKRLWADDWRFQAVLERLDDTGSVALEARPVLVIRGEAGRPDAGVAAQLQVGAAWTNSGGLVGLG
jgi:hypothetical protein